MERARGVGDVGSRRRERVTSPGAWPPGSVALRWRELVTSARFTEIYDLGKQSAAARRRRDAHVGAIRAESSVWGEPPLPTWVNFF